MAAVRFNVCSQDGKALITLADVPVAEMERLIDGAADPGVAGWHGSPARLTAPREATGGVSSGSPGVGGTARNDAVSLLFISSRGFPGCLPGRSPIEQSGLAFSAGGFTIRGLIPGSAALLGRAASMKNRRHGTASAPSHLSKSTESLSSALARQELHALVGSSIPDRPGVYALFHGPDLERPRYIGFTRSVGLRATCERRAEFLRGRCGITPQDVLCRYLVLEDDFSALKAAKSELLKHYQPEWNNLHGFGSLDEAGRSCTHPDSWQARYPLLDESRPGAPSPLDPCCESEARFIELLLQALTEKFPKDDVREMCVSWYGLGDEEPRTLEVVGDRFDISGERVRQRIKKALQRIASRRACRADACRQLHDYLLARLQPQEKDFIDRLLDFVETELSHLPFGSKALKLVLTLLRKARDEQLLSDTLKAARERDAAEHEDQKHLAHRDRLRQRMSRLRESVVWPSTKRLMDRETRLEQARRVNPDSNGTPGTFYSAKNERNVEYESQLERRFFMFLEGLDEVEKYQEQPYAVPYMLDGEELTYYPDVVFILKSGEAIVAELKPCLHMALHVTRCKWKGLQAFCEERGLGMLMTDDRGRTLETLKQTPVPATFETALLKRLERGRLHWRDIADLRTKDVPCHAPQAVVLRHDLVMRLEPFSIERKEQR